MSDITHELGKTTINGSEFEVRIFERRISGIFTLLIKGNFTIDKNQAKLMLVLSPCNELKNYSERFYASDGASDILVRYSDIVNAPSVFLTSYYKIADKIYFSAYLENQDSETIQILLDYTVIKDFLIEHNFVLESDCQERYFLNTFVK